MGESTPESSITPIFFQTSRSPLPAYIAELIRAQLPAHWTYLHFTDTDIIKFFEENPLSEFPKIIEVFHALKHGFHKADLFRYYFLYINGGVFMDSDAMIYRPINEIINGSSFFSVTSSAYPKTLFQGILGANPKNPILLQALRQCYVTEPATIAAYFHLWCKQIYDIVYERPYDFKWILYEEIKQGPAVFHIVNPTKQILFKHYWKTKKIPLKDEPTLPRLHILAVPYTITRDEYSHDAFTNRVKNFSPMMRARGFEVYHYGVETSESGATKNFDLMTKAEWTSLRIASLQWLDPKLTYEDAVKKNEDPTMIINKLSNWSSPLTKEFNLRLRKVLVEQYRDKTTDIVCIPLARTHTEALDNLNVTTMEIGIGYDGSCKDYRIFDSYSWMSYTLGIEKKVPSNYWFVIPHPYDISQFKVSLAPNPRRIGYMGRLVSDKGCGIIVEVAKRMPHMEFILCGQGDPAPFLKVPNVKYKAPIHGEERSEYLGSCVAVLTPTKYLEPFGCVMVEAQLCGTPVICSDWGGMAETVEQFKTGLRCHTLADYCHGIQMAIDGKFDRNYIRERAAKLYDMTILGRQYEYAFKSVLDLFNSEKNGWYSPDSHISAIMP